jgi:hypothetical protein
MVSSMTRISLKNVIAVALVLAAALVTWVVLAGPALLGLLRASTG